jgi:hypothetical protein
MPNQAAAAATRATKLLPAIEGRLWNTGGGGQEKGNQVMHLSPGRTAIFQQADLIRKRICTQSSTSLPASRTQFQGAQAFWPYT